MRKLALILITMGMASFSFAQNAHPKFELSKFRNLGELDSDYEYLNEVQNGLTPNQVKYLENMVSFWDVTKSEKFDSRQSEPFSVTFKLENGYITASYDRNGKIVSALERFSNFALPKPVSKAIVTQYPDWKVIKNRYSIWYIQGNRTKKVFKVQIRKGNQKKWLRVKPSGGIS